MNDIKFRVEYLIESIFYNRGMIKLISIGFFSLLLSPGGTDETFYPEGYKVLYSLLIGVGLSGLFCWIFAFKIFNQRFSTYYYMWLTCYSIEILFYLFMLTKVAGGDFSSVSILGLATGIIVPLVLIETLLNFRYKSLILCKVCTKV